MDDGCRFLESRAYGELCGLKSVTMSFCDYNARALEINIEGLSDEIACGSQFENAAMAHNCDKLIVL